MQIINFFRLISVNCNNGVRFYYGINIVKKRKQLPTVYPYFLSEFQFLGDTTNNAGMTLSKTLELTGRLRTWMYSGEM